MTISDAIVLTVGIANCATMYAVGLMGRRNLEANISREVPNPTLETKIKSEDSLADERKLKALCALLFVGCVVMLCLMWHLRIPLTFGSVLEIDLGFLGMVFAIVIPPLSDVLDTLRLHILITKSLSEQQADHFELMKMIASEVDKKAYSRKKVHCDTEEFGDEEG